MFCILWKIANLRKLRHHVKLGIAFADRWVVSLYLNQIARLNLQEKPTNT